MRFLKPAIATAAILLGIKAADAADVFSPKPIGQPVAMQSNMNWTGFYAGLNGGYGWTDAVSVTVADPTTGKSTAISSTMPGGFVGGGQIGYNWQSGYWLFGFEVDIQYADLGGALPWGNYNFLGLKSGDGQYFGTLRARLGYAMDRTLVYLTGGYAYGGLVDNALTGNASSNQGYALGGGFEYAFTENWTGRVEGLYVNLDSKARTVSVPVNGNVYAIHAAAGGGAGLMRVGVNYKF